MMRFDPTLIVKRLVVERNEKPAYDEKFHSGVNVIYGENASGKSTILNFIFYALGGELTSWSEEALLCTRVLLEAEINGNTVTLSREVTDAPTQPMEIYGGELQQSRLAPRSEWVRYPYHQSASRESFSQAIFRLMHMPEVETDFSGNITMYQILRLLYADQTSPIEDLFRFERFDKQVVRDTVGRLLCGAYDSKLYKNIMEIRHLTKEFDTLDGELRSLFQVLGRTDHGFTSDWVEAERHVLLERQSSLQKDIQKAEQELYESKGGDQLTLKAQEAAYKEVQELQKRIAETRSNRDGLAFTIADSAAFVTSLERKVDALQNSDLVAEEVEEIRFESCPACYAVLDVEDRSSEICFLCKTPITQERARGRITSPINDLGMQIRQSRQLRSKREKDLQAHDQKLKALTSQWERASRQLTELEILPSSEASAMLRELNRRAGYSEREIEDLDRKAQIADLVRNRSERKDKIRELINKLQTENEIIKKAQEHRLNKAYAMIADNTKSLLRSDLRRQDSFENPEVVQFSFESNKISVDRETYFSASSLAILKSSFYLGFFEAATEAEFFRHPRFCMIDTHENMGMEQERSHNFQHQIAKVSAAADVEHQIIYATAMIAPDMDNGQYKVGRTYTRDHKTLDIG